MKSDEDSLPKFHLLVIVAVAAIGGLLAWGIPQYSEAKAKSHKSIVTVKSSLAKVSALHITIPPPPPAPPVPGTSASHKILVNVYRDTLSNTTGTDTSLTHSKTRFKIVIEDDKGNKKEYNSISDLPQADKDEFMKENPNFGGLTFKFNDSMRFANIDKFKSSPEWQKMTLDAKIQAEKVRAQFNSPEWKKKMADIQVQSKLLNEKFNSPEWKKKMADIQGQSKRIAEQFNSPEWKKKMADIQVQSKLLNEKFNSPEWKKQVEDMQLQSKKMAEQMQNSPEFKKQMDDMKIQSKKMAEQFNSPQWRKQQQDMKVLVEKMSKHFNSPEWKANMKNLQKQAEEIGKSFDRSDLKKQMENLQLNLQIEDDQNKKEAAEDSVRSGTEPNQ